MAKFLDGPGVQASLTDLIKTTEKKLFIISPYLKISQMMKNYLVSIDSRKIPITIIYRSDSAINDDDKAFFTDLANLNLYHCANLHTKCFINEKMGIISSMNLHEHSQTHNWEMGIRFLKQDDGEIYSDVINELRLMGPHLTRQTFPKTVAEPRQKYPAKPAAKEKLAYKPTEAPNKGLLDKIIDKVIGEEAYCIRCGKSLEKFDLQNPYCGKCHASWAKYKNPKYKEKFCHACGSDKTGSTLSFEKPICKSCYAAYYKK